jgi:hypothetical protein
VCRDFLKTGKTLTALNIKKFVSVHLGEQKTKAAFIGIISRLFAACSVKSALRKMTAGEPRHKKPLCTGTR